jgi:hypothetical protein
MKTITKEKFYSLLEEAYAVDMDDTLLFLGYDDEDEPYLADDEGREVFFTHIEGDIVTDGIKIACCVGGEDIELKLLKFHEHFFKGKWEPVIMQPQDYDNVVLLERLEDYDLMVAWQDGSCDYVIYKGYYN